MIPVGDSPRASRTPWVTYILILVNIAVFVRMLSLSSEADARPRQSFEVQTNGVCYGFESFPSETDRFVCRWGFQPQEFFDTVAGETDPRYDVDRGIVLLTVITAMFLHGGWLHIIGNMLFLWVFGDNVEDRLGRLGYLLFYVAGGVIASLIQGAMDPGSAIPVVGASGAVAAVLGAYLFMFPKASVNVVIPFFILIFIPIPVPAVIMIGLWFLQNLLAGAAEVANAQSPSSGVAWFAHIGGFVFGFLAMMVLRPKVRRPPPRWYG